MIRTSSKRRVMRLAAAATVGLVGAMVPMPGVGADDPTGCDYRTDSVVRPAEHSGSVGGVTSGSVNIRVTERTDFVDNEDVTVLVHWVGDDFDLGPAPAGDPVFDALPAGYSVVEPPVVVRDETSVDEDESFRRLVGCPQDGNFGEDWTGDPNDPFSWVTYDDVDIDIEMVLVQEITRTHHITETRTHQVVRDEDGPGSEGPEPDGPDEGGPNEEGPAPTTTTTTTTTLPDADSTPVADDTNAVPDAAETAETQVLSEVGASSAAASYSTAGVRSATGTPISFAG